MFSHGLSGKKLLSLDDFARAELVRELIGRFSAAFPRITYENLWMSDSLNAQAVELPDRRVVMLYGGLSRHSAVGRAGLAFALAHETGHFLGEGARHPYLPWLSSEKAADEWALKTGLPTVFSPEVARRLGRQGRKEVRTLGVVSRERMRAAAGRRRSR